MIDLATKKDYDLKLYSISSLIGVWWTPHYAVRKVRFYENGTFLFENGDGKKIKGNYHLNYKTVSLNFNNGLKKNLNIGGGYNNTNFTLMGEGENFVKK